MGEGMVTKSERLTQGDLLGSARAVVLRTKERRTMAPQKSERRTVPEGRRKPVPTQGAESLGGGRAAPVNERTWQLGLRFETAEEPEEKSTEGADGGADTGLPVPATRAVPKSKRKEKKVTSATMEEVCERLTMAFQKVWSNQGAPGPDRKSVDEVREHLPTLLPELCAALLTARYEPGSIRRVWIPKAGGGERWIGIPNVVDRVVQEAVRQALEPLYEPTFHTTRATGFDLAVAARRPSRRPASTSTTDTSGWWTSTSRSSSTR